jgi:hypothetical protein
MSEGQAPPPLEVQRPWYFHNIVLVPVFILGLPVLPFFLAWPLWSTLILRSPWHTGLIFRSVAWAILITGAGMLVLLLQPNAVGFLAFDSELATGQIVARVVPGIVVTIVIQVMWTFHKRKLIATGQLPNLAASQPSGTRRRASRRRGSRPGRASRHPR